MKPWLQGTVGTLTFAAAAAIVVWVNLGVLCLGDPKFAGGCGGFDLEYPIIMVFFVPLAVIAAALALAGSAAPGVRWLYAAYAVMLGAVQSNYFGFPPPFSILPVFAAYTVVLFGLLGLREFGRPSAA